MVRFVAQREMSNDGKSLSQGELKALRERMNSLPYLWSEHIGKTDIMQQVVVPNESLASLLQYLGGLDDSVKAKMIFRMEDQGNAIRFTVPRNMYDDEKRMIYDVLGPERYNDRMEVFRYHLGRLIAEREGWSKNDKYGAMSPSYRDDAIQTMITIIALLLMWYFFLRGL